MSLRGVDGFNISGPGGSNMSGANPGFGVVHCSLPDNVE